VEPATAIQAGVAAADGRWRFRRTTPVGSARGAGRGFCHHADEISSINILSRGSDATEEVSGLIERVIFHNQASVVCVLTTGHPSSLILPAAARTLSTLCALSSLFPLGPPFSLVVSLANGIQPG